MKKVIKIICIILIVIVLIFGSFILFNLIRTKITDKKIKENETAIKEVMNDIENDFNKYVIIEINPKFALEINKDKVKNLICLNTDCEKVKDNVDVIGKELKETIEIIYDGAKKSGFKADKVTIKSSNILPDDILNIDYVEVKYIKKSEEDKELNEVIDNNTVSKINEKLNEDKEKGTIYDCTSDGCYIKKGINLKGTNMSDFLNDKLPILNRIQSVLKRFGVDVKPFKNDLEYKPLYYIYINGNKFHQVSWDSTEKIKYEGIINCMMVTFYLTDINLLNPSSIQNKMKKENYAIANEQYKDQYTYIPIDNKVGNGNCGDKLCLYERYISIPVYKDYNTCEVIDWKNEDYHYYISDPDETNEREIPKEEKDNYSPAYGYVLDYPECIRKMNEFGFSQIVYPDGVELCREKEETGWIIRKK